MRINERESIFFLALAAHQVFLVVAAQLPACSFLIPHFTSNFLPSEPRADNADQQAAELLQAVRAATNAAQRVQWQNQVAADQVVSAEQQRLADEEVEQQLQARRLVEAAADEEEKKKNSAATYDHVDLNERSIMIIKLSQMASNSLILMGSRLIHKR
ncbi:hypothetical protein EDB19DRAFT_1747229 [Suillus lakei]|nr:hypothetical protein EDB19DRAFT_1747229 [Suillus lakei]